MIKNFIIELTRQNRDAVKQYFTYLKEISNIEENWSYDAYDSYYGIVDSMFLCESSVSSSSLHKYVITDITAVYDAEFLSWVSAKKPFPKLMKLKCGNKLDSVIRMVLGKFGNSWVYIADEYKNQLEKNLNYTVLSTKDEPEGIQFLELTMDQIAEKFNTQASLIKIIE